MKKKSFRRPHRFQSTAFRVGVVVGVCALGVAAYAVYHYHQDRIKSHSETNIPVKAASKQSVIGNSTSSGTSPSPSPSKSSTTGSSSAPSQGSATTTVQTPSGIFVSNHHPSLSSSNSMASTCITTPGIQCEIQFNMDGVTKTLGPQTTASNGAATWSWTLQEVGLTQGTWIVTAVAAPGASNSVTATDPMQLTVGP